MDFVILIDALRHDFISADRTPYLHSLKVRSITASVIETYAFQTRPAFFAGLVPDESGICHLYKLSKSASPFHFLSPYQQLLRRYDPWGFRKSGRGIIKRLARHVCRRHGHFAAADVLSTSEIPLHLLSFLAPAELHYTDDQGSLGSRPTLFDHLRERGKSWNWIGYPRHFGSFKSIASAFHSLPRADVTYLHFSELDWTGHRYGPDSPEIARALETLDTQIRDLIIPFMDSESRIIVFGDHGMATVTHRIDLLSRLRGLPYTLGKDYVVFLDSTQARFWFMDEDAKVAIHDLLESIDGGHILTQAERAHLGIAIRAREFGETIFAVDGAGLIHPSFFDHSSRGPLGMHGYLPSVEENKTQIFLYPNRDPRDLGTIEMTDLYGLMKIHLG